MLSYESEFAHVIAGLWELCKSMPHPDQRLEIGRALTANVPGFDLAVTEETRRATAELQQLGYSKLGICLDAGELAEVRGHLERCQVYDGALLTYQEEKVQKREFALTERPSGAFLLNQNVDDLIRCRPLLRLACDPRIVGAVAGYIGCTPTISAFLMWHSLPGEVDAPGESFHRDRDCFRFVKLFVYLNEVDDSAGPHEYYHGSHSLRGLDAEFRSRGLSVDLQRLFEGNCRHLQAAELRELLGANLVRYTGPAGFGFLEDTFGLHRGTRPASRARQIFSVTYTGLPLRFANQNDRHYEMGRHLSFAEAGLHAPTPLERYLLRFFLR